MDKKIKKWTCILLLSIVPYIIFAIYGAVLLCKWKHANIQYPMPMLGIDAKNWVQAWSFDLALHFYIFQIIGVPCLILIIVSIIKIVKYKKQRKTNNMP